MKEKTFLLLLVASSFLFAQESKISELSLYKDITLSYGSGFYPGVITKAKVLKEKYPDSVYMLEAMLMNSDALIRLGNYENALSDLKETISLLHSGRKEYGKCYFLLGQAYYFLGNYSDSFEAFNHCCSEEKRTENVEYYYSSVLYGARIRYIQKEYSTAKKFFEEIIQNGRFFSKSEYLEACEKYMDCCNQIKDYKNTIALFTKLKELELNSPHLSKYAADAYEATNQIQKSQELYQTEIPEGNRAVEFWISVGVDSYKKGENKKALESLKKAREVPQSDFSEYAAIVDYYELIIDEEKILGTEDSFSYEEIENRFKNLEKSIVSKNNPDLTEAFYSNYLLCKIYEEKWSDVHRIYSKLKNPSVSDKYSEAYAFYNEKNYVKTISILEPICNGNKWIETPQCMILLAQTYEKRNEIKKAWKTWAKLDDKKLLSDDARLEYAKCLFIDGLYSEAYEQSSKISGKQGNYMAGMCCINLGEWKKAEENLSKCSDELAGFYKNYAIYRQEDFKRSYEGFKSLARNSVNKSIIKKSYNFAAKSGVQIRDFTGAAQEAEQLILVSDIINEREEAVFFCAEIYSDAGEYEKTIATLEPYSSEKSEFGVKVLFLLASTYSKLGNSSKAEEAYSKVVKDFPKSEQAEEALYRCGEVYYLKSDYDTAKDRFTRYLNSYSGGKFCDSAYYYAGDCYLKLKEKSDYANLSIVMNKTLISRYPQSVYLYGAYHNLMEAEYFIEDYEEALNYGKILLSEYQDQAVNDGIGQKVVQFEQIVGGTDKRIVEKKSFYTLNGGASTPEGREIGTEIVQLYDENKDTKEQAYKLAVELFSKQKIPEEAYWAAQNAEVIARWYVKEDKSEQAGNMFLKAAEYYRAGGEAEKTGTKAALALYNAVENFRNAGLRGDAQETANLLIKLYPETKQAKSVTNLLRK